MNIYISFKLSRNERMNEQVFHKAFLVYVFAACICIYCNVCRGISQCSLYICVVYCIPIYNYIYIFTFRIILIQKLRD